MKRPDKGTPEWDLWIAAIEVAIAPPLDHSKTTVHAAKVRWKLIEDLRDALEAVGIDWQDVKAKQDARNAEHQRAKREALGS